jgi:hypothetical protein
LVILIEIAVLMSFCVASNRILSAYLNSNARDDPRNPIWTRLSIRFPRQGYLHDMVRLADIDSDGRVNYLGLDAAGNAYRWRNVGTIRQQGRPGWI